MKRPDGTGSVAQVIDPNTGEVRHRARGPREPDGTRAHLGIWPTKEEAEAARAKGRAEIARTNRTGVKTFAEFGAEILDERELNGVRGIKRERSRFAKHLATAKFAAKPVDDVKPADIAEWLRVMGRKRADDRRGDRPLDRQSISRCLSLATVIFDEAGPQGRSIIDSNPCFGMKVKKRDDVKTEDVWTFLTLEEQEAIRALDPIERWPILFAFGTGLRQSEQFHLELRDLHVDGPEPYVFVRFGGDGKMTKSKHSRRRVPLFGFGLEAAREWLKLLPSFCEHNFDRLVFPTASGCRRGQKPMGNGRFLPAEHGTHVIVSGKPQRDEEKGTHVYVDRFELAMRAVGITRNVRWHDLRHTCASALVAGMWGDPWTLEEVKDFMGHSSILVTQRYAHLGETALKKAAKKVRIAGGSVGPALVAAIENRDPLLGDNYLNPEVVGRPGLEPGTYGLKGLQLTEMLRNLTSENGFGDPRWSHVAATLVEMLEGGCLDVRH